MIDFYTWTTPNGRKVSILLEELGADYRAHAIDMVERASSMPRHFLRSAQIIKSAIHDHDTGMSIMEIGSDHDFGGKIWQIFAWLWAGRTDVLQWLMWQMGGLGPMLGQVHQFVHYNKGISAYAEERFTKEAIRLYGVLDAQLQDNEFIAGDYSIADMACWPWISRYEWQEMDLNRYPHVQRWYKQLLAKEAVQKGYHVPKQMPSIPPGD